MANNKSTNILLLQKKVVTLHKKYKEMNTTTYTLDLPSYDVSFFKALVKRFGRIVQKQNIPFGKCIISNQ